MERDTRDTPNVVEHDEAMLALHNHAAGFEDSARTRRIEEILELPLPDEPQHEAFMSWALPVLP